MNKAKALLLVACVGITGSVADAQPTCTPGYCGVEGTFSSTSTAELQGTCTLPSCPTTALVYGTAFSSYQSTMFCGLSDNCTGDPDSDGGFDFDQDSDSDDAATRTVSAGIFVTSPVGGITGTFNATRTNCFESSRSTTTQFESGLSRLSSGSNRLDNYFSGMSIGYAAVITSWEIDGWPGCNLTVERTRTLSGSVGYACGLLDICSPPTTYSGPVLIQFYSTRLSGPGWSADPEQGLIAVLGDGTIIRRGGFADSNFDPTVSGGYTEFNGSDGSSTPIPNGTTELTEIDETDIFNQFDGDVDRSGSLCWDDRRTFINSIGLEIGETGYNPRMDWDLDGEIEEADYSAFLVYFNANACVADFNCSGTVTSQDTYDFLTAWSNSERQADLDNSGTVTTQDLYDFLAIWSTGC